MVQELIKEARLVADEDIGRNKEMGKYGAEWLLRTQSTNLLENGKVNVCAYIAFSTFFKN